jgi:hypothetical protein|tara:strand:- start:54 stop:242 length:189 start_codon:yes stop_codon:yes gene_type:complete
MKQIEFTDEERTAIIQLLDLAVKNPVAGGLKVSGAASFLASKFADPAPPEEEQEAEVEEVDA